MTWALVAMATVATAATVGLVISWTAVQHQPKQPVLTPELTKIWAAYVNGDRPVLLVLGTPLFAKYTTTETGVFFRDPRVNEWVDAAGSAEISKVGSAVGGAQITASRIYTGVGEATGAFLLSRLFSQSNADIALRRSHALTLDDFKGRNVIVLGAPKHNAHLRQLQVDQQFVFFKGGIRNLSPRPGEPEMFSPKFAAGYEEVEEDHALISRFPGLHGMGQITVLGGGSTEATLAAVEFVTQPRYAAELTAKLRNSSGALPRAFQVVVRARFKSQTPFHISYVSHRVLEPAKIQAGLDPRRSAHDRW